MAAKRAGKALSAAVGLTVLLQLGGAHKCTVTQEDDQTTYDIPDLSGFKDAKTSKCTFSWSNASDTVVGTHNNRMEPVTSSGFGKLVSSRCIGNMSFSAACELEGTAHDYTASCSTSCTPEALIKDKGNSWITVIAVVIPLLLLACLLGFLCYKYKISSCSQTGGFYAAVKFQKGQQAADVERGKEAVHTAVEFQKNNQPV